MIIPKLKEEKPFLKTVYSSPLKNVGLRLKQSFKNFFNVDSIKHPKYLSWKRKWFSLLYNEPTKGIKIERDKNSAINIVKKENLILSGSDYLMKDNNFIKYTTSYSYKTNKITIEKINDYTDNLFVSLINNEDEINEMYRFV